jgi:hypothetical protein
MHSKTLSDPKHNASMGFQLITESNQVIEFVPEKIKPFSFSELQQTTGDEKKSYKLDIITNNIDLEPIGKKISGGATISGDIVFHYKPKIFTLVDGGWLPPRLVSPANFLADRNVVSVLSKLLNGSDRADHLSTNWWLNLPDSSNLQINPLFYALEGNKKETPSFDEFCRAFMEAATVIRAKFPNAKVTEFSLIQYQAAYEHVLKCSSRLENESKFLITIAKTIVNRTADRNLADRKKVVLQTSDKLGLNRRSLVVLAALSCIYESRDGAGFLAARQVLKPKPNYQETDAYNALSDLRALELFIAISSIDAPTFHFCTCDCALAGLWCGLNPRNARWENDVLTFDMSLDEALFPRLPIENRTENFLFD